MHKLTLAITTTVLLIATAYSQRGEATKLSDSLDFSNFPIVDFEAKEPTEPKVKAARNAKARKYSRKYGGEINEELHQIFTNSDWDLRLPALPVARSAAIFIGTVVEAEAHLTPDKSGVFSVFAFQIESILKSDPKRDVKAGETISVERNGGRVRMPSGKLVVSWTSNQNMPKVGSRYVLFLTHDFETAGDTGNDFYLLTGYEFKDGKVLLLDSSLKQEVLAYKGATESSFLKDLFIALKSH
ncbi:MAG TPA: hypothetical protein VHH35_18340 [Pyrinomonadaceae bacterium]|nr:hypothetical protein [Pyrinomonadaceae bacterium]